VGGVGFTQSLTVHRLQKANIERYSGLRIVWLAEERLEMEQEHVPGQCCGRDLLLLVLG